MLKKYAVIKNLLIFIDLSLFGYLIWDTINTKPYVYKPYIAAADSKTSSLTVQDKKEDEKQINFYLDRVSRRNIFLPQYAEIAQPVIEQKKEEPPKIPISTLVGGLKIVGLSFGNPSTVMIEDSQSSRTYFLAEGDTVGNNLVIKSIVEDGVVISDGIEEIKLK